MANEITNSINSFAGNADKFINSVTSGVDSPARGKIGALTSGADPKYFRLLSAGLNEGANILGNALGTLFSSGGAASLIGAGATSTVQLLNAESVDWRIKLKVKDKRYLGGPLLRPLAEHDGLMFPYTPTLMINHASHHNSTSPTHSNYPTISYQNSTVDTINIDAEFTAQSHDDGLYCLAAIHFIRSVSKMWSGQDQNAGTPPPLLFLEGYGTHLLPSVPVVVTNTILNLPPDVDYISVNTSTAATRRIPGASPLGVISQILPQGDITKIPSKFSINITVTPAYSRTSVSKDFSLGAFINGQMINNGSRGGFI